jgi:hypothetical protein
MNRSILIAICDFTILSILSVATFGPQENKVQPEVTPRQSSLQEDLYDQLKESIDQEREERLAQQARLEEQQRLAEEAKRRLEMSAQEKNALAQRLKLEQAALELEREKRRANENALSDQTHILAEVRQESKALQQASEAEQKKLSQSLSKMELEIQHKKSEVAKMEALAQDAEQKRKIALAKAEEQQQRLNEEKSKLAERLSEEKEEAERQQKTMVKHLMAKDEAQQKLLAEVTRKSLEAEQSKVVLAKIQGKLQKQQKELLESQLAVTKVEHEKNLAEQEIKFLAKSLEITQDQVVSSQKVSAAMVKLESHIQDQKRDLGASLKQVVASQTQLTSDLKSLKPMSSHEIFQMVQQSVKTLTIKVRTEGLFGSREEVSDYPFLPISQKNGEFYFTLHAQSSPLFWNPIWGDALNWQVNADEKAWGELSMGPLDIEGKVVLGKGGMGWAQKGIQVHPEPRRSEYIVVVDLQKMAYAQFPLKWHPTNPHRLIIESALSNQMFGPLALKAGQMIFASDGRLIGPVMENKEGLWLSDLAVTEWWELNDVGDLKENFSEREHWRDKEYPRQR